MNFQHSIMAIVLGAATYGAAPAQDTQQAAEPSVHGAATRQLTYSISRKGNQIGEHNVNVTAGPQTTAVSVAFSVRVKFLGITAYRMDHEAREVWNSKSLALQEMSSLTDRASGTFKVTVDPAEQGYLIAVNGVETQTDSEVVPTSFTLSRHLFADDVRDVVLLDTLSGLLRPSRIHPRGIVADFKDAAGAEPAGKISYYEIERLEDGQITHHIWYDETEAFLKVGLKTKDGHYIEYLRQA